MLSKGKSKKFKAPSNNEFKEIAQKSRIKLWAVFINIVSLSYIL
jgi:hypothetical protein